MFKAVYKLIACQLRQAVNREKGILDLIKLGKTPLTELVLFRSLLVYFLQAGCTIIGSGV